MSRGRHDTSVTQIAIQDEVYEGPPPSKCAKFLYYSWKICSVVFSHFIMICLVIAYCILGAFTFEKLEAEHEREIKRSISLIRGNVTQDIWRMTKETNVLYPEQWTANVTSKLKSFEADILSAMKNDGWDGIENEKSIQWTFTGALFYSIIVITTIGYGHIAPKTQTGKVVTIFYAILGIPLMLLCLSNIGDVMASSFRFLYWRVCCYVCTRPPKRRRRPHRSLSRHTSTHILARGRPISTRRRTRPVMAAPPETYSHSDTECRYRDSGYPSTTGQISRRIKRVTPAAGRVLSQPPGSPRHATSGQGLKRARSFQVDSQRSPVMFNKYARADRCADDDQFPKISLPLEADDLVAALYELENHGGSRQGDLRSKSLPRPPRKHYEYGRRNVNNGGYRDHDYDNRPDRGSNYEMRNLRDVDYDNFTERQAQKKTRRNLEDFDDRYERTREYDYDPDDDIDLELPRERRQYNRENRWQRGHSEYYDSRVDRDYPDYYELDKRRRARSMLYGPDRRGHEEEIPLRRQLRRLDTRDETSGKTYRYSNSPDPRGRIDGQPRRREYDDEWSDRDLDVETGPPARRSYRSQALATRQSELQLQSADQVYKPQIKPVPIWLCVFLVVFYIVAGTFLFHKWEKWQFLDSAYFCFITLTTIGFGDFVPAQGIESEAAAESIALCSLYLLFGISLLAMSFNLVQEEVIANVKAVAKKLGIIKSEDEYSESE